MRSSCPQLTFLDSAGHPDFDEIRPLTYPGTDIFWICFSLIDRASFEAIKTKWIPEIQASSDRVDGISAHSGKFVIVGTKTDVRSNLPSWWKDRKPVSFEEGNQLAQEVGALGYFETNCNGQEGYSAILGLAEETVNLLGDPTKAAPIKPPQPPPIELPASPFSANLAATLDQKKIQ